MKVIRRSTLIVLGCLTVVSGHIGTAAATELWLAGVDPFVRQVMRPGEQSDYLNLFDDGAPWPRAAKRVQVFKTSTQYLLNAPDDALRHMFAGLRKRGIALAFEGLMIPRHEACGQGIEGYSAPGAIQRAAERAKRLGGDIQAVAMDEPLWFGHHFIGPHACASSIEAVAQAVAENVAALRAVFPSARVGEIEPLDLTAPAAWADEIDHFVDAYASATGTRLDFFDADLDWNGPWRPALTDLVHLLRTKKIPLGIIYNGNPQDDTDEAWTRHAAERFETLEADPDLLPDQAILQTWMVHPHHMLPETMADTMTGLVLSYIRPPSFLSARLAGRVVSGRLIGANGRPITNAVVVMSGRDASPIPRLITRHISGVVPARAATALIALRLNTECGCSGAATVWFAGATFQLDGRKFPVAPPRLSNAAGSGGAATFNVVAGEKILANGAAFPVTPSRNFGLDMPFAASQGSEQAGYIALIFLDSAGQEVRRSKMMLGPGDLNIAAFATDAAGNFSVIIPKDVTSGRWNLTFAGNSAWRGTAAKVQGQGVR